ncbi:MAG: TetR/AcrR family transcriptional regulator [Pseudomonadota bacterium]
MKKTAADGIIKAKSTEPDPISKSAYHHGDLRAGLIEATRRLVEERGQHGFSVSDACRLAGVSTAAPYKHFKDKDEMIVATVLEGMARHRANMLDSIKDIPEGSPMRLKALGKEYINFALNEPGIFRLKFGGFTDKLEDDRLQSYGEQTFGFVLQEVAKCIGETEINQDVRDRGFMLWSFVHGLSFLLYDKRLSDMGGDFDLEIVLADIAKLVLARKYERG